MRKQLDNFIAFVIFWFIPVIALLCLVFPPLKRKVADGTDNLIYFMGISVALIEIALYSIVYFLSQFLNR